MNDGRSSRSARDEQEHDVTKKSGELLGDGDVHGANVPTHAVSSGTSNVTERKGDVMQRPPAAVSEFVHRIGGVDPDERNPGATQFSEQSSSSDLHSGRG